MAQLKKMAESGETSVEGLSLTHLGPEAAAYTSNELVTLLGEPRSFA